MRAETLESSRLLEEARRASMSNEDIAKHFPLVQVIGKTGVMPSKLYLEGRESLAAEIETRRAAFDAVLAARAQALANGEYNR